MHIACRAEVDGLRAVAILPVVLFHLGVAGFLGGFVGVDVFFVISGFLITSIIHDGIRNGNFLFRIFDMRGGVCHTTHLEPDAGQMLRLRNAGIHRVIVHVRDPRQTLVSMVHHLDMYPEQMVGLRASAKEADTVSAKAMAVLRFYRQEVSWITRWVEMEKHIAVHFSTFESMVSDWDRFVDRYIDFYGGYSKVFSKKDAETRHETLDYHFRSGRSDEWREVFSKEQADELSAMLPQNLKDRFDWPE